MQLYRAILIDPELRSIRTIETTGQPSDLRLIIGATGLDWFRIADHERSFDYGWVADDGLTRGKPIHSFKFKIGKNPIAGRCVLIGAAKETGETADVEFQRDIVEDQVDWLGLILPEVTWDNTDQGSRAIVTYSRVRA